MKQIVTYVYIYAMAIYVYIYTLLLSLLLLLFYILYIYIYTYIHTLTIIIWLYKLYTNILYYIILYNLSLSASFYTGFCVNLSVFCDYPSVLSFWSSLLVNSGCGATFGPSLSLSSPQHAGNLEPPTGHSGVQSYENVTSAQQMRERPFPPSDPWP